VIERPVDDPELASFLAACLFQFQSANYAANISAIIAANEGPLITSIGIPGTSQCPTIFVARVNGGVICLVNGSETLAQATGYINGAIGGVVPFPFGATNEYLSTASGIVRALTDPLVLGNDVPIIYAGFSLGGAVLTVRATSDMIRGKSPTPKLVTFGAPRALGDATVTSLTVRQSARYMMDADPIPLLPPRIEDAPWLIAFFNAARLQRFSLFRHVAGGFSMSPAGVIVKAFIPLLASVNFTTSLANWMWSFETGQNNQHSLINYRNAIDQFILNNPPMNRHLPDPEPVEPRADQNRNDINVAARENVRLIFREAQQQNSVPVVVPAPTAFDVEKTGRIWSVTFGGQFVCVGPTKRKARAIKNFANEFLRRLQTAAVVDPTAIISQFPGYFDAATNPGNGFSPVMSTTWPQ